MMACTTCGKQLGRKNKTGHCRLHASAAVAANPEWRAKQIAGIRRKHAHDPEFLAALRARARMQGTRMDTRQQRSERFKRERIWEIGARAAQTTEARAKAARSLSATRMAWCPPELLSQYRELTKLGYNAPEARRLILEQHESDMTRFRAKLDPTGVSLPDNIVPIRPAPVIDPALSVAEQIIAIIAWHFEVEPADIAGKSRRQEYARPRHAAVMALRSMGLSLNKIGAVLGGRDHSTILNSLARAEGLMATDAAFAAAVNAADEFEEAA